ncbi:EamA family transporter [Desulfoluna sp.]|uniref:EamA family transporter n=1 Tax=Desulfoluna sp. TaxID=2045199 RepID=UPI00261AA84B|nr:EamA family transporter [Desulfoluna sp.]
MTTCHNGSTPSPKQKIQGTLIILIAALFWASSATAAKHLFLMGMTPGELVQMRVTLSAVFIGGGLAMTRPGFFRIEKRDLLRIFTLGFFGMAMVQFTYLFAISRIHVAVGILMQYLAPALIFLWALAFGTKKPSVVAASTISGTIIGCYFVSGAYDFQVSELNLLGLGSGLASAFCFALYTVMGEGLAGRYDPKVVTFYAFLVAAVVWNIAEPPFAFMGKCADPSFLFWGMYVVLFGTVFPFLFYAVGVTYVSSINASITATTEPIFAGLISWVFIGESLTLVQMVGAALVLLSISVLTVKG